MGSRPQLFFPHLLSFSLLQFSRDLSRLNRQTCLYNLAQSVEKQTIVAVIVLKWYRNMNLFPFPTTLIEIVVRTD